MRILASRTKIDIYKISKMVTKHDYVNSSDEEYSVINGEDSSDKKSSYLKEGLKAVSSIYKQWGSKDALIAVMG